MLLLIVLFITIITADKLYLADKITCVNGDACDFEVNTFICNETFCEYYAENLRVENLLFSLENNKCHATYDIWKTKDDDRLTPLKEFCITMKESKLRSENEEECFMHRLCDFVKDITSSDLNGSELLLRKVNPYTKLVPYKFL